ncbi:hypothetical protein [Polymorphum gilvum]|uniref:Uncharacterized protein n=1 Tax=Polymorphum gilvum (strain LMG 25793 / CGMCC 1.9160 / SL003B-26A1) TaxID=991905 RepID=F2J5N0_POLGS|nr:hypothetical protein [Polymorphum gilvum]ADZ70114.1 hypothetical protein SL003B_1686 [Polymorphum gilvum SL003B-26A1]
MALIDRVKERTGTDLSDDELTTMIGAITAELDARLGPVGEITVELGEPGEPDAAWQRTLRLARPLDTGQAVTVVERDPGDTGTAVTLSADDYRVLHGGRTLQRLSNGSHPRATWAPLVTITYTPAGNAGAVAAREEATIKLMALDLSYRGGLKSERAGDYQFTLGGDPAAEREAIIAALAVRHGMVMA